MWQIQEARPNNWGTHACSARVALARYFDDNTDLDRAGVVLKAWMGDRSTYSSFNFGDLHWQSDESNPRGINPLGATKSGHNIDGVLPDDQRRAETGFIWPPPKENYVWEALQGAVVCTEMLHRAGYDSYHWEDNAIYRAVKWLYDVCNFPPTGDDLYLPWIINFRYDTNFATEVEVDEGKNNGWTSWTFGPGRINDGNPTCDGKTNAEGACNSDIGHGSCTSKDNCFCISDWQGVNCESPRCDEPTCTMKEFCISPDNCICIDGWSDGPSNDCEIPTCSTPCSDNFECSAPNTCSCKDGWIGPQCNIQDTCDPKCTGNTECDPTSLTCSKCKIGWNGDDCDIAICDEEFECNHNQNCSFPNTCTCFIGWVGEDCDIRDCKGNYAGIDCSECLYQYAGNNCETYLLAGNWIWALPVGLSIGIVLFLIFVVLVVIICIWVKKNRKPTPLSTLEMTDSMPASKSEIEKPTSNIDF